MDLMLWVVFGGLAGWLATIFVGSEEGVGIIGNIVIGILGAFIGGFISRQIGTGEGVERPTTLSSFMWAVLGAVVLLLVLNFFF